MSYTPWILLIQIFISQIDRKQYSYFQGCYFYFYINKYLTTWCKIFLKIWKTNIKLTLIAHLLQERQLIYYWTKLNILKKNKIKNKNTLQCVLVYIQFLIYMKWIYFEIPQNVPLSWQTAGNRWPWWSVWPVWASPWCRRSMPPSPPRLSG